jgi:hypothetical protein
LIEHAVADEYRGRSPAQLLEAPVTALKGIADCAAQRLEAEFAIRTVRDLAVHKHAGWARAMVQLASTGLAARAIAASPVHEVRDISERQTRLLAEEFGIETVNDLGTHGHFNAAWAIWVLAESANSGHTL